MTDRLTEYHNGVAVIKGKRFKEAAEKLALYEDLEEQGNFKLKPGFKVIVMKGGGTDE